MRYSPATLCAVISPGMSGRPRAASAPATSPPSSRRACSSSTREIRSSPRRRTSGRPRRGRSTRTSRGTPPAREIRSSCRPCAKRSSANQERATRPMTSSPPAARARGSTACSPRSSTRAMKRSCSIRPSRSTRWSRDSSVPCPSPFPTAPTTTSTSRRYAPR